MNNLRSSLATLTGILLLAGAGGAYAQNSTGTAYPAAGTGGNTSVTEPGMSASGANSVTTTETATAPASSLAATPAPTTTTTTEKHGFDLGWLGLIGLAGLAGLRKRPADVLVSGNGANSTSTKR